MCAKDRCKSWVIVLVCVIIFVLPAYNIEASGLGLTFSTNTFSGSGQSEDSAVPPGLYCRGGLAWLPGKHLEIELYHIPQITPRFYSQVFSLRRKVLHCRTAFRPGSQAPVVAAAAAGGHPVPVRDSRSAGCASRIPSLPGEREVR